MNYEEKFNKVYEILEEMDSKDLKRIWNEYQNEAYYDDYIYDMEEFDEVMNGDEPIKIANKIYYGDFRPNDEYFCFNGYGNLKSFDYISEEISLNDLTEYIIDNEEDFGDYDLEEFFEEIENENEEE